MKTISYSQMSLFWECPRKWYNMYVEDYTRPVIPPFVFGSTVHKYIECKLLKQPFETDDEKVIELGDNALNSFNEFKELGYYSPQNVELKFDLPMQNGAFRGFIDLCFINKYSEHIIIDWKTTSKEYTEHDIKTSNQLTCYAYAYWRLYEVIPHKVCYITLNKKTNETKLYYDTRDMDDILAIEKQINDTLYAMDKMIDCKNDKSCIGQYGKCQFYKQCWRSEVNIVDEGIELWQLK